MMQGDNESNLVLGLGNDAQPQPQPQEEEVNGAQFEEPSDGDEEEEEEESEDDEESLPDIMGPEDPRRMRLTDEEWDWAQNIKARVEMTPELDPLTDFMYATFGIICKDKYDDALSRAEDLQKFRQEYDIQDTFEDGYRSLKGLFELFPEQWLSFTFSYEDGTYVAVQDLSKFDARVLTSPAKVRTCLAASYYLIHVVGPDLESVRKGSISLIECAGLNWMMRKQDFKFNQKMHQELFGVYPFRGVARHYNTGVMFNTIAAIVRKFLPVELRNSFQTGFVFEDRLDSVYLIPNAEVATQRMLNRMAETLKKRMDNEKSFSLAP